MIVPFYSFEMVLVGIILLGGMSIAGLRIWLKKRNELDKESFSYTNQKIDDNKDL